MAEAIVHALPEGERERLQRLSHAANSLTDAAALIVEGLQLEGDSSALDALAELLDAIRARGSELNRALVD